MRCCQFVLLATMFGWVNIAVAGPMFLFDATKAETAANADWTVDADLHNLSWSTGPAVVGGGSESNPQRVPTPAASGITSTTAETYWTGALSSWGVSLVKKGYGVESLPYNGSITYGNASNPQDLSNYKVFVVDEPNISFTLSEKNAILNFLKNGGGLIAISDHGSSDRNNDGVDSVQVWNDLFTTNSVQLNPFGVSYNGNSITTTSSVVDTSTSDPLTRGANGSVTSFAYDAGSTMTLDTSKNATVKAAVWSATATNSNVMAAYGSFGAGRFVVVGDSSPADDGTGDSSDTLYNGWTTASDSSLFMNASDFVAPEPGCAGAFLIVTSLMLRTRRRYFSRSSSRRSEATSSF